MPDRSRRVAAIDCGTNSIRLLIADVDGERKNDLVREMRIVRLGEDVDATGRLADAAVARTVEATTEYASMISQLGASTVRFCATSAVRDADNADIFGDRIEQVLGVRPEVLSGEAEAAASFLGATRELGDERTLVADIGGGSTEVVTGEGGTVDSSVSFDLGSVRLTERFFDNDPAQIAEIIACEEHLDAIVRPHAATLPPVERFVGVAGTITTVAAHALALPSYDSEQIHGARLHVDDVRAACLSLAQMSVADRRALPYMHPGRADVIGGGALILDALLDLLPLATDEIVVSERDILDGLVWSTA